MYPINKKKRISAKETTQLNDCFAEKAKNWLWILGIIVVGITVFAIIKFPTLNNINSSTIKSVQQHIQAQNVALNTCPYQAQGTPAAQYPRCYRR